MIITITKSNQSSLSRKGITNFIFRGDFIMRNVFDAILECGHDEDFEPVATPDFQPTDAPAGSQAKLEVLAERIRCGLPLWHKDDRSDYGSLSGYHYSKSND